MPLFNFEVKHQSLNNRDGNWHSVGEPFELQGAMHEGKFITPAMQAAAWRRVYRSNFRRPVRFVQLEPKS